MRHSVLSRWQGSLLGSALGERFTWQGKASENRWQAIHQQGVKHLATTGQWQAFLEQRELNHGELLVRSLPLLLFFHDQPQLLREQILAVANPSENFSAKTSAIIAYATVASWTLREQLCAPTLFRDLLATAEGKSNDKILQTLQTNLEKGETLQATRKQLPSTCQDIWLALYCFATTAEDFLLTLRRGQTMTSVSPFVLPLVGALSGAQNSISAIPIPWRCWLQEEKQEWEIMLEAMFATWSGSYKFARINQPLKQSAIAACQVIQPRKGSYHQKKHSE